MVLGGCESSWREVVSGVPQGSVLGPILFTIYINDLEEEVLNKVLKFADDSKILGKVSSESEINELHGDLERLFLWSQDWQMPFNLDKCKVMHLGRKNKGAQYSLGGRQLGVVKLEKDLGVIISDDLKVAIQCGKAASKGYQALGLVSRTFVSRKREIILKLYKSLVRPHLDYCVQAWRPHLVKDCEVLERVQRRATRMIDGCRGLEYAARLKILNLTTLETRRLRADLVEVYKIMHGMENVEGSMYFERVLTGMSRITRGNEFKLFKKSVNLDLAKYNFGNRVVDEWNHLPDTLILGKNLGVFKGKLDKFLEHTRGFT